MPEERSFAEIDLAKLETEWVGHVEKVREFAERRVDARRVHDEAKAYFEYTEAILLRNIRLDPDKYKLPPKPTEGAIKNCVLYQKAYKEAEKKVIQARYELDLLEAAMVTLDHRKRALENLVQLWSQGYFATPRQKGVVKPQPRT